MMTPEAIAETLRMFLGDAGSCRPQMQTYVNAVPCLPPQLMEVIGACYLGTKPPGMNDLEFVAACYGMANCGLTKMWGCPEDGRMLQAALPACFDAATHEQTRLGFQYCDTYPNFDGPDKTMNGLCWATTRYRGFAKKWRETPLCAGAAPPPPPPPPPPADTLDAGADQPVFVAPPPTEDQLDYVTQEPADLDIYGGSVLDMDYGAATEPPPEEKKISGTTWALIGIGGVVALGLGYMALRKR